MATKDDGAKMLEWGRMMEVTALRSQMRKRGVPADEILRALLVNASQVALDKGLGAEEFKALAGNVFAKMERIDEQACKVHPLTAEEKEARRR